MRMLILFMVASAGLFASWEDVRGVAPAQKIEVYVRSRQTVHGTFVSASEGAIVLREKAGERSIARDQVRSVRVSDPSRRARSGLIGTAIGLGVGLAIGWAVCPYCENEGSGGKYTGPGAAVGAGIGAAAGFLPLPYRTIYKAK